MVVVISIFGRKMYVRLNTWVDVNFGNYFLYLPLRVRTDTLERIPSDKLFALFMNRIQLEVSNTWHFDRDLPTKEPLPSAILWSFGWIVHSKWNWKSVTIYFLCMFLKSFMSWQYQSGILRWQNLKASFISFFFFLLVRLKIFPVERIYSF